MNRFEYAAKAYIKTLGGFEWFSYMFSLMNLVVILTLTVYVMGEHGGAQAAAEFAQIAEFLTYVLVAMPFVATAIGLSLKYLLDRSGYELPDELWPEVQV